MNIELPVATNVRTNTDSLYQQCLKLISKIYPLNGFDVILFPDNDYSKISDPVKIIWDMCRLGYPLCLLYNLLQPATPLEVKQDDNMTKANASKRCVFLFIQACRTDLKIPEDELFKITDIFKEDTNLFVKVVNVLNILLKTIEDRGFYPQYTEPLPFHIPNSEDIESPKDNRAKLVAELLNTERSYVQDLERLHNYQLEAESKILSKEDSITLFSNLGELLDFQRKFLIHMESALAVPTQEQRIGQLFYSMENGFEVYQIFCANQDKSAKFALEHCDLLMKLVKLMEPKYELPSYLIKPVQRICKYPLLLNELMKYDTKAEHPYCHELQLGLDSIKRVTEKTNEIKRQEENEQITEELKNNIQDWKNVKVGELGLLLLRGYFTISIGASEREYVLFLFQNMLLCCQEKKQEKKKKGKVKITYILKGSIYISSVERVSNKSVVSENLFALKIYWTDKVVKQSFTLKSISEEQCNRWLTQLEKLIDIEERKNQTLQRSHHHHDYNKQYNYRVNHVDGMFADEDYDNINNKGIHSTYSMYNKSGSRSGYNTTSMNNPPNSRYLNRSKSQPNIFNITGSDYRYSSQNQDVPPVPSLNQDYSYNDNNSSSYPKENSFNANAMSGRKNITSTYDSNELPAPQRTVSSHVKHNPSLNNLRHYPKYNESDDYYNKPVSPVSTSSHSSFKPQSTPLPPTPNSSNKHSLYQSKSYSSMEDEYNNSNSYNNPDNSYNNNQYLERKTSVARVHAKPLKINVEDYSNRRYNGTPKLSESYSEREDMGSISPSSATSNSLSVSYNEHNEPVSPTYSQSSSSFYHSRSQYNNTNSYYKPGLPKRNETYAGDSNYYRNDYNDYDYSNSRSNYRSDVEESNMYNSSRERGDYGNENNYDYERNRPRERSRNRDKSARDRDRERGGYDRDRDYDNSRSEMSDYDRYSNRRDKRDEEGYNRARSRSRNPNSNYRNPSSYSQESSNYDKPVNSLRSQSSVSSLSYDINKNNSVSSSNSNPNNNSNSSSNRNTMTSNNNVTSTNSYNNNYANSPRMRPSPPSTPVSRPSTPNLNRPSTPNLSRPSTPNLSRPSTPNFSRLNNVRRPSTPLSSNLSTNTFNPSSNVDNVRSNYTKIKINYNNQEFMIVAPSTGCTYGELISKIERKIRLNDWGNNDTRPLRIRYKDEDDDFVTIITDEDISLAFEITSKIWKSNREMNHEPMSSMVINLYVDRK